MFNRKYRIDVFSTFKLVFLHGGNSLYGISHIPHFVLQDVVNSAYLETIMFALKEQL